MARCRLLYCLKLYCLKALVIWYLLRGPRKSDFHVESGCGVTEGLNEWLGQSKCAPPISAEKLPLSVLSTFELCLLPLNSLQRRNAEGVLLQGKYWSMNLELRGNNLLSGTLMLLHSFLYSHTQGYYHIWTVVIIIGLTSFVFFSPGGCHLWHMT